MIDAEADMVVVGEADSAAESIRRVGFDEPDVVLMDVQLPDGTGIDATREILSKWPGVRVVILTSFADDEALHAAIIAGFPRAVAQKLSRAAGFDQYAGFR